MVANSRIVEHTLLPKQEQFLHATEREVLYSGAYAAAKTRGLCFKVVARASRLGAREGLCRKHLSTLRVTTLKTLLEHDGNLPPVLPEGSYEHNQQTRTIRIRGGGEIVYFGFGNSTEESRQKVGSFNFSGCAVDEAVELIEPEWLMLLGRIRLSVGLPQQLYGACNPGAPSHFLAKRFGLALDYTPMQNCRAITTKSTDNVFLSDDYIESLLQFTGVARKRYVDGLWVGSDGLVYDRWDRTRFVRERQQEQGWRRSWVGVDAGYTNPAVLLLLCEDGDGRIHVLDEWYETNHTEPEVVDAAKRWYYKYNPETFVVDPSAKSLIALMEQSNLPVDQAINDVYGGIMAVQAGLGEAGDGRARMTVDPVCQNTIREFETYEWSTRPGSEDRQDKPKKDHDHAMDALRYGIVYTDGLYEPPLRFDGVVADGDIDDGVYGPHTQESEFAMAVENDDIWEGF